MAHAIQLNPNASTIAKRRGLFQLHLATMLVGKLILAALLLANAQINKETFGRYGGWPCKSFYYGNDTHWSRVEFVVIRHAFAANTLVCLTLLLVPVACVEWRCRNGRIADMRQFLARIHWGAKLAAATTGIALLCLNVVVMEQPEWPPYTFCGWPFTFGFELFPWDADYQIWWFAFISGYRYLILNLYFAAFASLLTLLIVQQLVTRFSLKKTERP